jgi:hypothetical protein
MTVVRSSTMPTAITLCEQLARHWAQVTRLTGGLRVVEREGSAPDQGSGEAATPVVMTAPMASKVRRPALAASIRPAATAPSEPLMQTTRMTVVMQAAADTDDRALLLLTDLRQTVAKPDQRPFAFWVNPSGGAFPARHGGGGLQLDGVIGPPPMTAFAGVGATLGVWSVLFIDVLAEPQLVEGLSEEGQRLAEMSLVAAAVPVVLTRPIVALTITRGELPEETPGEVVVWNHKLRLRIGAGAWTEIDLLAAGSDTIGELAAVLAPTGWTFGGLNGAVAARAARDLAWVTQGQVVLGNGDSVTLGVWA